MNARPSQGDHGLAGASSSGAPSAVLKLLRALYDDAPVALARKKALADLAVYGKPLQASLL